MGWGFKQFVNSVVGAPEAIVGGTLSQLGQLTGNKKKSGSRVPMAQYSALKTGTTNDQYNAYASLGTSMASGPNLAGTQPDLFQYKEMISDGAQPLTGMRLTPEAAKKYESGMKEVSQETLDKMMSMFEKRKKGIDQVKSAPGRSQMYASPLNIG